MKHKIVAIASLLLLVMIQSGCGGVPTTQAPAATEAPTQAPTEAPGPAPRGTFEEVLAVAIRPVQKPSLEFTDSQNLPNSIGFAPSLTVAFVFPDGPAAVKAAGVQQPKMMEDNFTAVGIVEVADGAIEIPPGIYRVEIDLTGKDADVSGRLVPRDGTPINLKFHRTELARNPDRPDEPSYPVISPIIGSDAVCFVVGLSEISSAVQAAADVKSWVRYCSGEADTGKAILAVQTIFQADYTTLSNNMTELVNALKAKPTIPDEDEVDVLPDLTISEIEGHGNINACSHENNPKSQACQADIIGAPSKTFWDDYEKAKDNAGGNNFVVTEGFLRVARRLEIPKQQLTVEQGSYWIRDLFDPDGKFLGTSLLGWTDDNTLVNGLSIPATPTYFLDPSQPQPVVSWISGWHCIIWCKLQPDCP